MTRAMASIRPNMACTRRCNTCRLPAHLVHHTTCRRGPSNPTCQRRMGTNSNHSRCLGTRQQCLCPIDQPQAWANPQLQSRLPQAFIHMLKVVVRTPRLRSLTSFRFLNGRASSSSKIQQLVPWSKDSRSHPRLLPLFHIRRSSSPPRRLPRPVPPVTLTFTTTARRARMSRETRRRRTR